MPVPIVTGRLHEPFNFALGEVLTGPIFGIRQPTTSDCSLYIGWSAGARSCIHWQFSLCSSLTVPIMGIISTVFNESPTWLAGPAAMTAFAKSSQLGDGMAVKARSPPG